MKGQKKNATAGAKKNFAMDGGGIPIEQDVKKSFENARKLIKESKTKSGEQAEKDI